MQVIVQVRHQPWTHVPLTGLCIRRTKFVQLFLVFGFQEGFHRFFYRILFFLFFQNVRNGAQPLQQQKYTKQNRQDKFGEIQHEYEGVNDHGWNPRADGKARSGENTRLRVTYDQKRPYLEKCRQCPDGGLHDAGWIHERSVVIDDHAPSYIWKATQHHVIVGNGGAATADHRHDNPVIEFSPFLPSIGGSAHRAFHVLFVGFRKLVAPRR